MVKGTRSRARSPRVRRAQPRLRFSSARITWAIGLTLLLVALLTLLSLVSREHGAVTTVWLDALRRALGWGAYLAPLWLAIPGIWLISRTIVPRSGAHGIPLPFLQVLGGAILYVSGLAIAHQQLTLPREAALLGRGGGYVGYWVGRGLTRAFGWLGAMILLAALAILGLTLLLRVPLAEVMAGLLGNSLSAWSRLGAWSGRWLAEVRQTLSRRRAGLASLLRSRRRVNADERLARGPAPSAAPALPASQRGMPSSSPEEAALAGEAPSSLSARRWALPRVGDILVQTEEAEMSLSDIRDKARIIEDTLTSLGVPATVVEVNPGPVVTQFGLEPGYTERRDRQGRVKRVKIKVSRIQALSNDLALALAASPIRIEAPVPGKGVVGLEVPNSTISTVGLRGVMESDEFTALGGSALAVCLGRDVSGAAVVEDLGKLPHLLIAGATGSGKSVCINALIACLLCRNTPEDLRLLMIDPKRVELSAYNGVPHLLAPVVVEVDRVVSVLRWVTHEMDHRYKAFAQVGARNIQAYNAWAAGRAERRLPYIVVFIDELADLMMVSPEEVERSVCRIAQLARATGIHLVIATQRPSVDVVTGLIKANFPARLSFAVSSQVDSRVILDIPGAEKLLGRGDALYMAPDSPKLSRIQGCYVSDEELARLVGFWRDEVARQTAETLSGHGLPGRAMGVAEGEAVQRPLWPEMIPSSPERDGEDPLLQQAIALVASERRASVSFLQRRLRIGYTRAARLIDLLEERGVVGPATGTGQAREVHLKAAGEVYSGER